MDGGNSQVGGNIVLRYPLDDVRSFLYEVHIALLRGIPDTGEEFVHIMALTFERNIYQGFQESRIFVQLLQHLVKKGLGEDLNYSRFNGFYSEYAGNILLEAIQGSNAFIFKKELKGGVFSIVVKPDTETALFNEIIVLRGFALG